MKTAKKRSRRPPFKCHGGKFYLAHWIVEHFPENYEQMVYVEPFCGGASVFFNKNRSTEECLNDIDAGVMHVFRALRDEPTEFIARLKRTVYSERAFKLHLGRQEREDFEDYMSEAITEFVLRRMSRGGMKKHFAWSTRTRGGKPGDVNAWETILAELPLLAEEMKNVYLMNENALKVINVFNSPDTLLYLDPPYLPDTRTATQVYDHEMTADDHIALIEALNGFKGKVILSGYPSKLYKCRLESVKVLNKDKILRPKWRCDKKMIVNHASQTKKKEYKSEMLWMNY